MFLSTFHFAFNRWWSCVFHAGKIVSRVLLACRSAANRRCASDVARGNYSAGCVSAARVSGDRRPGGVRRLVEGRRGGGCRLAALPCPPARRHAGRPRRGAHRRRRLPVLGRQRLRLCRLPTQRHRPADAASVCTA